MKLLDIKQNLNITVFELNTATDKTGAKTEWMRHWDNTQRIAVSIHKNLVAELQDNPNLTNLGMQTETRNGEQGEYKAVRIVKFKPAEVSL